MEMIKDVLTRNIRAIRKERGFTQEALAEKTGYSTAYIKSLESGRHGASMEVVEKICQALDVSYGQLFASQEKGKLFDMPMSKAIKKLLAVPDEVYERAQLVPLDDKAWETVIDALEIAADRIARKKGNHSNHS